MLPLQNFLNIALEFRREVEKAEGILADASVAGEDVGTEILASQQRSAGSEAEISRLEERLKAGGLGKAERAEILA